MISYVSNFFRPIVIIKINVIMLILHDLNYIISSGNRFFSTFNGSMLDIYTRSRLPQKRNLVTSMIIFKLEKLITSFILSFLFYS